MNAAEILRIRKQIQKLYLEDQRPWIIGYSGGKDSTVILQLVFEALQELNKGRKKLRKHVYVISSDTLVESPPVVKFIEKNLEKVAAAAKRIGLPMSTHLLTPAKEQTFWVNLIGRGYPPPNRLFRWCTERLKISTADTFITERVSEHGEVILVLGIRRDESMTRAQSLALYSIEGTFLKRHTTLPNSFVYAPIEFVKTNDIWVYLMQNASPWGGDNKALLALYKSAQSGECPLVVDKTTPSCGNSRFGCWTCTVVDRDKSMEFLVENGEEWMEPLMNFRNKLVEWGDPKAGYRSYKRKGGGVYSLKDGTLGAGPFTLEARQMILRKLLELQNEVPHPVISASELEEINKQWVLEGDWGHTVKKIVAESGLEFKDLRMTDAPALFGGESGEILAELCAKEKIPIELVQNLLVAERDVHALARRIGVMKKLESVLGEPWSKEDAEERLKRQEAERKELEDSEAAASCVAESSGGFK